MGLIILSANGDEITQEQIDNKEYILVNGEYYPEDEVVYSDWSGEYILKDGATLTKEGWVTDAELENDFVYSESTDNWHIVSECVWSDLMNGFILEEDVAPASHDQIATESWFMRSGNFRFVESGYYSGKWVHLDYLTYCIDIQEYVDSDDAYLCEADGEYYYDESSMPGNADGEINGYHSSEPRNIAGESRFKIGFEIEKKNFMGNSDVGDYVGTFDLIAGFETDSSCGVEAVTHILPLGANGSEHEKLVFNMIDEASEIVESDYDRSCGGHINVSSSTYRDGYDLLEKIRVYSAIFYAMYRHRLRNSYCSDNKLAKKEGNTKYSPLHVKGNVIEFRLPSAVRSVRQLKSRYRIAYNIMLMSEELLPFEDFLELNRPVLMDMYKESTNKVETIFEYARAFRRYLLDGSVDSTISEFI